MQNNSIRIALAESISQLTKVLEVCEDGDECHELRIKIRELTQAMTGIVLANLNADNSEFDAAIDAIEDLTQEAKTARAKLERVVDVINKATKVVASVAKLVKGVA